MRLLAGLAVILAASSAQAGPNTLVGDIDYNFVDQNGFGWAMVGGKVTVTLTFAGKAGSLKILGKRRWIDSQVKASGSGAGRDLDTSNRWEGEVDETYPLDSVVRTKAAITFKLAPVHDKLTGSCAPTKITGQSNGLYECTIAGFQWHTIANLPELHHSIVLDTNRKAKRRILNAMSGGAKAGFGKRVVSRPKAKP